MAIEPLYSSLPTTNVWDPSQIYETEGLTEPLQELLVRLYQNLNQMALAAGRASLGDEKFIQSTREQNQKARAVLTDYLDQKGIFYGKSHTNFVFFESPADGKTVINKLKNQGYLIRIWNFKGKDWCRVSIGTVDDMQGFVKAFRSSFS